MRYILRILPMFLLVVIGAALWADSHKNGSASDRPLSPIGRIARADSAGMPDGEQLIEACQSRLLSHRSISSQVRQRVQLFDRQLFGSGIYLQQGSELPGGAGQGGLANWPGDGNQPGDMGRLQFRFELDFQLEDRKQGMIQSSDGTTLWLYDANSGSAGLRKVDLERLSLAVELPQTKPDPEARQQLAARVAAPHGGVPRLLHDLHANFEFHTVGQSEIAGVGVWVLQGVWRPERLGRLSPTSGDEDASQPPKEIDVAQLGPHVPHDVLLYLDRDELFPYRIQYRRLEKRDEESAPEPRTLVEMELFEVRFDAPIEFNQFGKPIDIKAVDYTETYAKRLRKGDEG